MTHDEVVCRAVAQNGAALQYAADSLRADRAAALAAVASDGLALRYASEALRAEEDRNALLHWKW